MSKKAELERAEGPRRAVNYIDLVELWPDGAGVDPTKAVLEAPADVVLEVVTRRLEHFRDLLTDERTRGDRLQAELNGIRVAARTLGALFDEPRP